MKSFVSKLTNVLGNTAKVADLGEENQFYFSQEWNCWVEKGKEAETLQNLEKRVCPPPSDKQIQDRHQLPPLLPKARPTGIEALMQPPNYRLPHHHKKPPTTENFGAATDFDDNANQWDGVASMEKISECTQPVPSGNFNAPVSLDDDDDDEEEQSRYWPTNENFMSSHNQEEQQQQRWGDDEAVNSNDGETASKWEANRYVVQQQRNSSYHTQYPPSYDNPPLPPSYKTGSDLPYDGRPSAYHPPLAYGDPPACGEPPSYGEPPSSGEPPYDRGGPYGELSAFDVRADPPSHNGGGAPPYGELSAFDDRADPPLYNGGPPPYGELSSFDDRADPPLFNGGPPPYGELSAFDDRADPPLFNGGPPAYGEPPAADDGSDPPPYNRGPPAFDGRPESPPYNDGPPPYGELTAFNDLQEPPPPPYNGDPLAYGEEPPAFDDGLVPYDGGSYGDPSVYDDSKFPPSYGQYPLAKTIEVPPELPVSSTDERGSTITFEPENNSKTQFAPNSFEPSGWVEAAVSNAQASNTSAKWQSTFLTAENVSSEVDRNYGEMQFPKHHDSSTTTKYEVVANLKGKYYQATGATLPWREEVENEVLSPKPKGLFSQSPDNTKFSETVSSCRNKCPPTVLERKQLDSCEESSPTPKLSQRWNSDGIFHTRPVMTTSVTHLRPKAEETIISGIQKKTRKGSERGTTHIDNPHFVVASDISSCSEDSLSLKEGEEPPFAAPPNDSSSDRETLSYIHSQLDSLKNWSKTRQLKNDDWQVKLESLLQKFSTSMENALTRKSEYIAQLCDENNSLKDTMNLNNSRLESLSVKFKNTLTQLRNSRESESRKLADATAQLHNAQEQLFLDKRNAEEKEVESLERLKLEECAVKDKHDRIILDAQQKAFEIVDEANTRLAARWKAVEEVEKISAVRNKRWEEQRKIIETTMNDELIERKRVLEMQEAEMQHERTTLEYHRNQTQIESKLTIEKAEIDASNIREVAQAALLRVQDKEAELNVSLCDVQGREDELNDKIRNFETYQALAEEEQRSKYLLLEQDINDEKNLLTNKYATMFADLEKRISEHFALVKSTEESLKTREESLLTSEAMLQSKLAESQLSIKLSEEQHSELMATETSILQKKRDSLDALEVSLNKRKMELASEAMRLKELDHELTARSVAQALEEQRSREDMKLASSTLEEERIKFEQFVTKTRLEIEEEREEVFIETERIEEEKTKNENDIATFEEEMNSRNKQISFELSKLESDKHDFELLRKSFEEASAKLESDRASFLATWNEFNNRNEALHSEILELTEREEVLETDLQELNRDRMEFEEEKRQFLAERDEIHSEKAQIERELADGKQSLEEQRQELRLAEEFHQNELQHLKSATDQLEAQQRQLGNLENQLTKKEHELLVKHDQILEEQQELQRERESLARVTVNDECNGKLKEEQAKLNELWQEFNLRNEALQQEFQSQVQLAQELEKAKDEIEVQKGELGAMQKQLTRQQQELLMEQQELQKERASLAKERVANNHEGKTEQEQAKLNEQWKEFHLRNESLQQEFQSQLQLAQELEKAKVDMEVQQRELGNLQKQLHEEQQQLLKEREQLLTKQDELQQDHSLLAEERDSLATRSIQSAEIEKDVERWKTDLQQINEEKENLELALRETRQALEDREAALKAARESLDAAKSEKQLDLESWEKELNSKAVDLMMEKNKIDSSMAAIETAAEEKELVEQKCRTLECLVEHLSGKWDRLVVKYPGMANQIDVEIASLK